ncbi:acylneuraminate cytidylyltransferase family protein [Candidatus Uabimicrobium amorphum]|uniref:CMP-N-acetlyneuraminic acid synthetase n=1 Tax=Uabimicrobium amorphum TaxID=2596890 RepID=A0A5S9ITK4_UABAM|nr:acylneuraminate cytidylyltransferase family protein [Candidatus Uabimicrobium amorphum]BBM87893.1 hypothetical protein UABAM_06308 [Candidatus Uabimicrobium amorphum]
MYNNKNILAIIPARAGSKRVPNKNIKDLAGKPLIGWTIEAATKSRYIDNVVVSTDSEKAIEVAKSYDIEVPFVRPAHLATDAASSMDVITHALEFLQKASSSTYEYIMLLQPTSPLRDHMDIDNAIEFCFEKNAEAVISVCEMEHSPLWSNTLPEDNSMENFISKEVSHKRSQELPTYYRLNGAIYLAKTEKFLLDKTFFLEKNIFAYVMPNEKSVDIDNEIDMYLAQSLILSKKKQQES